MHNNLNLYIQTNKKHVSFHKAFTIINYHMCVSLECIQVIFPCQFVMSQYLINLNAIFHKKVILLFHLSGRICIQRRSNALGTQIWLWIMLIFNTLLWPKRSFLAWPCTQPWPWADMPMNMDYVLLVLMNVFFLDNHWPPGPLLSRNRNSYTDKCTWI